MGEGGHRVKWRVAVQRFAFDDERLFLRNCGPFPGLAVPYFVTMREMRCLLRPVYLSLFCCLVASSEAFCHQVPNMTVEADFAVGGMYELRINLDPRVFLSRNPSALAPLDASWFLEQTPEQRQQTFQQAEILLNAQLKFMLGASQEAMPKMEWQPLDGATQTPMHEETEEVHFLATLRGKVPEGAGDFALGYAKEAQVSLILIVKTPEVSDPRVQVMFPGESSRAMRVPSSPSQASLAISSDTAKTLEQNVPRFNSLGGWAFVVLSIIALVAWFRSKTNP
jgi:hypothetical protein